MEIESAPFLVRFPRLYSVPISGLFEFDFQLNFGLSYRDIRPALEKLSCLLSFDEWLVGKPLRLKMVDRS
jgi:hypothetical protein